MQTEGIILNRVEASGLVTIDLETFYPKEPVEAFDLKDYLFRGLIVREKEYREALKQTNWQQYEQKHIAVYCSTDAIIPVWAYMLAATYLQPVAKSVGLGSASQRIEQLILSNLQALDPAAYVDKRVVIKGCGEVKIPDSAYLAITALLQPVVKSIMYGEPCSTVPVYKKK